MRLFELAKELNTSSKELLAQANGLGVEITSYVSKIDDEDAATIRNGFKKRSSVDIADEEKKNAERQAMKKQKIVASQKKQLDAEGEKLNEAIERSKRIKAERDGTAAQYEAAKAAAAKAKAEKEAKEKAEREAAEAEAAKAAETAKRVQEQIAAQRNKHALPERPVQAPRPEVKPAAPAKAEQPAAKPAAKPEQEKKQKPAAPAPAPAPEKPAQPKFNKDVDKPNKDKKKPPRGFHPDDEDEEDALFRKHARNNGMKQGGKNDRNRGNESNSFGKNDRNQRDKNKDKHGKPVPAPAAEATEALDPAAADIAAKIFRIHGPMLVKDIATKLDQRPNIIIASLMKKGIFASINQAVDKEVAIELAKEFGFTVEVEKARRSLENHNVQKDKAADDDIPEDTIEQLKPRPPVVTFLGHVDHGKTSLMDFIRKAKVAAGEAGGITQHINAYTIEINDEPITFLDTPGHAAFSAMRARGANLTDIAVIIIAADDGIMPQTKEAIKHARNSNVTIMVAINKCDLSTANPDLIYQQLATEGLTPEDWGGDTIVCKVSARTGEGVDHLLEMILLQAEVLELRANPDRRANGTVVEAQMQPGSGPMASVLVTGGTLNVGDIILCGEFYGKIRALTESTGKRLKSIGPSRAATVMGLSGVPEAGAEFRVIPNEKRAKELAEQYAEQKKLESLGAVSQARSIDDIFKKITDAEKLQLTIILRADVQGSVEAIEASIAEIKSEKVSCNILHSGTGAITSNDVQSAGNGTAIIIGFGVSPEAGVLSEARHHGVLVKTFRIIYELLDYVKQEMLNLLPVEHKEVVIGHAQVKQIFELNRIGVAAGSLVTDGVINVTAKARVLRNKKVIHSGDIKTIRHFKDEVKEVRQAMECGILLANYEEFREGDVIECFTYEELPKVL